MKRVFVVMAKGDATAGDLKTMNNFRRKFFIFIKNKSPSSESETGVGDYFFLFHL